MSLPK
jgi:hypothetical protein